MKRELMDLILEDHQISKSRACKIISFPRSQSYYRSKKDDTEVVTALQEHVLLHPNHGFALVFAYIRRRFKWNHKRVYRVYKMLRLNIKRKPKRRLAVSELKPLIVPQQTNECWSIDFMSDSLTCGRKFRTFNIIDDASRLSLLIGVASSFPAQRVVRSLEQTIERYGRPRSIRCDNGPEFQSNVFKSYCSLLNIAIHFIEPGKPMQNAFVERFNGTFRREVLDAHLFSDLRQAHAIATHWQEEYNERRPHQSLSGQTPSESWQKFSFPIGGASPSNGKGTPKLIINSLL